MQLHYLYVPALIFASLSCSSCREAVDDVVLESTSTVQMKWNDLVPAASNAEINTFVKFDLSAKTNLVDVWDGLVLQVECGLAGSNADESLDSVTFGPFYHDEEIGNMRLLESESNEMTPNKFGRFEYVVFALPNFEVGKLVSHRRESWSVFDSDFENLTCYFRGAGMWPSRIPESVSWSLTKDQLLELTKEN